MSVVNLGSCGCCGPAALFDPIAIGELYFDVETLYDEEEHYIGRGVTYVSALSWVNLYQTFSDDPSVDVVLKTWSPPEAEVRLITTANPDDPTRWSARVDVDESFSFDYDADGTPDACRAVGELLATPNSNPTWQGGLVYRYKFSVYNDGNCSVVEDSQQ